MKDIKWIKDMRDKLKAKCPQALEEAENVFFSLIVSENPKLGERLSDEYSALLWDNYLTVEECNSICAAMRSGSGKNGFRWTTLEVERRLKASGEPMENFPYYNLHALVVAVNMIWSDHWKTLEKIADGSDERLFRLCYDMAIEQLCDEDKIFRIRSYFKNVIK